MRTAWIALLAACGSRPAPTASLSSTAPEPSPSAPTETWHARWGDTTEWFELTTPDHGTCDDTVKVFTDEPVTCESGPLPPRGGSAPAVLVTPVPMLDPTIEVRQLEAFASIAACEQERPLRARREALMLRQPHDLIVGDLQRQLDSRRREEQLVCARADAIDYCPDARKARADAEQKLAAAVSSEPDPPPPLRCEGR